MLELTRQFAETLLGAQTANLESDGDHDCVDSLFCFKSRLLMSSSTLGFVTNCCKLDMDCVIVVDYFCHVACSIACSEVTRS